MFELITDIYRSPFGDNLGFKGGTMAYFFYGLDRFSVDLDFDLLDQSKKEEIITFLPKILSQNGEIKDQKEKRFTLFYLLNYGKGNRNIKIEISKRNLYQIEYLTANFYGTDVKIPKIEDAFATKLLACTTRKKIAYRDFYDVYFYLKKGVVPNEEVIFRGAKKPLKEYLLSLTNFIEKKVTNRLVLNGVGELVDEKQKVWIRNHFKKELINRLQYFIDQLKRSTSHLN